MKKDTKRYIISTAETFFAAFFGTFLMLLETAINTGNFSNTVFMSIISASAVSGIKVVIKKFRENI